MARFGRQPGLGGWTPPEESSTHPFGPNYIPAPRIAAYHYWIVFGVVPPLFLVTMLGLLVWVYAILFSQSGFGP